MTVDDLKFHYGVKTDGELAKALRKTPGAISKWRSKGISASTQAILQIQTNGVLKANLKQSVA